MADDDNPSSAAGPAAPWSRGLGAAVTAGLALLALLAYAPALGNGFVWDDHAVIERGRLIGSLANLPRLFVHDTSFNSDGGRFAATATVDTYRPLTLATFFLERALFGLRPWAFHLGSVLVHLANVLALRAVGRRLGAAPWAAVAAAALFAVHPAISEAVYWINGRSDPLYLLALLAALWVWLGRGSPSRGLARGALVALLVCAATLCKETAFVAVLPVALLALDTGRRGLAGVARSRAFAAALAPWIAGCAAGLALRYVGLHRAAVAAGGSHVAYALARLPALWLDVLASLVTPSAWMVPSLYERYAVVPAWRTAVGLALVLALALYAYARLRQGRVLPAYALATLLLTTAPVALLTFDEGWSGWGRYLYAPAAFVLLAVADELARGCTALSPRARVAAACACALLVVVGAVATFTAARSWRDDRARAERQIAQFPGSSMGYSELAVEQLRAGDPAAALALLERAVRIAPRNWRHWSRAASALMALGRRGAAFGAAQRALALNPADPNARYITAIRWLMQGREADAARALVAVAREQPEQPGPWTTLREALARLGPRSPFAATVRAEADAPDNAPIAARLRALVPAE